MVIFRSQNVIIDFLMILAWVGPFKFEQHNHTRPSRMAIIYLTCSIIQNIFDSVYNISLIGDLLHSFVVLK